MRIDKTGPDSESQCNYYKFMELRCGKVCAYLHDYQHRNHHRNYRNQQPSNECTEGRLAIKTKKINMSNEKNQCAMRIDKTDPDSDSQCNYYEFMKLRCGKVCAYLHDN